MADTKGPHPLLEAEVADGWLRSNLCVQAQPVESTAKTTFRLIVVLPPDPGGFLSGVEEQR